LQGCRADLQKSISLQYPRAWQTISSML
jgi:hypothetical protein